jgi:cell wall-associated NlpC family hydrolase
MRFHPDSIKTGTGNFAILQQIYLMEYALVAVPAAPVRRKPDHRREMVNQLLFGETVQVLKRKGKLWAKVRSLHDGYEGWMTTTLLQEIEKKAATVFSPYLTAGMLNEIKIAGSSMLLPVGTSLPSFFEGKGQVGTTSFTFSGLTIKRDEQQPSAELVKNLSLAWLNAPYCWGGRTPLGVDCSGFVQVVFKMMGIDLPRDAWQQAQTGKAVKKLSEAQTGDLAFFDNKEDIVHVGIILDKGLLIHASGKVRIDQVNEKGIVSDAPLPKGSRLRALRRYW